MSTHPFAGMYAAMLTPLTHKGELDPDMVRKLFLHLLSFDLHGVYVAGSTGEGMRLPLQTRRALVETLMEWCPQGKKVIVHVGTPNVRDAISLAEHAAEQGAHAISSLPPAGDSAAVLAYYVELAHRSPLPLIIYYFPKLAPHAFQNSQDLLDLCDIPNVAGVKFTDFNFYLLNRLVRRGKLVFNGYDEALAPGLLIGAQGGIGTTYNLLAPVYVDIYRAVQRGDWATARSLQFDVNATLDILFRYPFFPAVREAVRQLGFDCGPMASGDDFASASDRKAFIADMTDNLPAAVRDRIHWLVRRAVTQEV